MFAEKSWVNPRGGGVGGVSKHSKNIFDCKTSNFDIFKVN